MSQRYSRKNSATKSRSLFRMPNLTSIVKNMHNGVVLALGWNEKETKKRENNENEACGEFASLKLPPKMRQNNSASSSWTEYSETVEYLVEDNYEENSEHPAARATAVYEAAAPRVVTEQAPAYKVNSNYKFRLS